MAEEKAKQLELDFRTTAQRAKDMIDSWPEWKKEYAKSYAKMLEHPNPTDEEWK